MATAPLVYLILGTPGAGRREIVRDLVDNGLAAGEPVLVLLAATEPPDPAEALLAARAGSAVRRLPWPADGLPDAPLPAGSRVFLLANPRTDTLTQIEDLKRWLAAAGATLARVFTVVDCNLAERQPPLLAWYTACVHFSDVVLLTRREGVANKWLSEFRRRFEDECVPSHILAVKKGGLANPALVLEPEPRRLSQYFDEAEDLAGVEIETEDDAEPGDGDDLPAVEAYFERNRSGRRVKEVPAVADYLDQPPAAGS